jgi:glycosyltransferase involved in cell wall biosynthesis
MSSARVTVAVPTRNRSELLRETLASVLAQTYPDFRVIVGDNASDDDTQQVVQSIGDARVEYVRSDRDIGHVRNFNRLIGLAQTEFLVLLPDDDLLYPNFLQRTVAALDEFETAGLVHTAFHHIDEQSRVVQRGVTPVKSREAVSLEAGHRYLERSMMSTLPVCFSSVVYRTGAITGAGGLREDEEPFSDMPLWMRIAVDWDLAFVTEPLVGFREHLGRLTTAIAAEGARVEDSREMALLFAQFRFDRRADFLNYAGLPPRETRRLRSIAELACLAERSAASSSWSENMRGLLRLANSYPEVALRPPAWRLLGANLGARRLRRSVRRAAPPPHRSR